MFGLHSAVLVENVAWIHPSGGNYAGWIYCIAIYFTEDVVLSKKTSGSFGVPAAGFAIRTSPSSHFSSILGAKTALRQLLREMGQCS